MIQNKIHTKDRPMKVHGQNNEITFLDENGKKIKKIKGLELTIIGNCNKVIINTPTDFTDFSVWIEGNCGTFIFEGSKNKQSFPLFKRRQNNPRQRLHAGFRRYNP